MTTETDRDRSWWKIAVPILAVAALLGVMAGIIVRQGDDADGGVTELVLEPVSSVGNDPFTPSLVPSDVEDVTLDLDEDVELVRMVLDQINPPVGEDPDIDFSGVDIPESEATVNIAGNAPGLYGGTNLLEVCDRTQLTNFLLGNDEKGSAWAGVHGIDVSEIPSFIATLTDVILQTDTRVTNHGFRDGEAYPIDSVLQAGTAVMVDRDGVPRVRCYCGNPLTEARQLASDTPALVGERWQSFDLGETVVISAAGAVDELVLDDVASDNFVVRAPGAAVAEATMVDTDGEPLAPAPAQPDPTPTPAPEAQPTQAATATPEPPPTPRPQPTVITGAGTVSASSVFGPQFAAELAVDGSRGSSWFSAGGGGGTFTWSGPRAYIDSVDVLSNASHDTVDFRTGFGFESVTISVLDDGSPVYSETFGLGGTPDPDITAAPGVEGDTIVLEFSGGEDPTCGGFSELIVRGSPA